MVEGGSELTRLTQLLIFDYWIMVSIVNKLSAKHPATLAISDTILLYHLIKVKPRLDVKVERPEMVYQEVKEANQYANIILNGQEKEKAI